MASFLIRYSPESKPSEWPVTEKTMQYNISSVDASIKFGSLATGTYYFVVKATDASGTRTLLSPRFLLDLI